MSSRRLWLAVLLGAALLRLATLSAYPFYDTTEARYAEIGRLMLVSDDWITPQIEPGVPFWAKPPLSTWATAGSFRLFGINEFAGRLPSLVFCLLTLGLMFFLARKLFSADTAIAAGAILMSSGIGFAAAGAVMTDAALTFATTLSLVAFWFTAQQPGSPWRYLFFVGLALGMLAKGPVALVLVGLPVLAWSLWHKGLAWLWHTLPWLTGGVLLLALASPWYIAAEIKTPGFLEYYFVGEHWLRFVESGWPGDLYGEAHARVRGTIWLYGLLAALPWSLLGLYAVARALRAGQVRRSLGPLQAYLLLWALAPFVFFTFSANILAAYILPGLPAFSLLLGDYLVKRKRQFAPLALLVPGLIVVAVLTGLMGRVADRSQQDLVALHYQQWPASDLRYFPKVPHSASFYSAGRVQGIRSPAELADFLASGAEAFVALRTNRLAALAGDLRQCLHTERVIHDYSIVRMQGESCS